MQEPVGGGHVTVLDTGRPRSKRFVMARRVMMWSFGFIPVFFVGFPLLGMLGMTPQMDAAAPLFAVRALIGFAASAGSGWLTLRALLARVAHRPYTVTSREAVASMALLGVLMVTQYDNWMAQMVPALWWASVVLAFPRREHRVAHVSLVLSLVPGALFFLAGDLPLMLGAVMLCYLVFWAGIMLLANWSLMLLWDVIGEAYAARDAQARLAVTEERLRFARDMHDLIGHSLSGIAVKSELAARLAERDPARAAAEMRSVQQVAREALREVRAAVSGYRDVDLAEEIASVRAVLVAAGTQVTVTGEDVTLPAELRALAAWVVREGVTNVLRHSSARRCDIALRREGRVVVVEVHDDGAQVDGERLLRRGNGLTGLTERVAAVGGALSASPTGERGFLLRAVLPLPAASSATE
ncbi:sensor histidine kinase [Marinactinospora thermotolerans]|uniref:Two-component system, NarL family, sensor histidine kinase DesK n=1 Tax=Marinactinospora thermotolerans DSM 45154 TaxID=1122192 RepID=A0A1T4TB79_9ACTN|nr:histidine kinase [Marinactinospora thermotolerans]SKA37591.1 two-component system, NarL family, sensor histidine kinase DesK [Marinactinospora thermotolerans DSM 45154]